jgi:hypothetical protein
VGVDGMGNKFLEELRLREQAKQSKKKVAVY